MEPSKEKLHEYIIAHIHIIGPLTIILIGDEHNN